MYTAALLLLTLAQPTPPTVTAVGASGTDHRMAALQFLRGDWDAAFTITRPGFVDAVRADGTVRTTLGPDDAWIAMTATTHIPGAGPYAVNVLLHPAVEPGRYRGFARTSGGHLAEYMGGFTDDSTLVLSGTMNGVPQRISYRGAPDGIDFLVEDAYDGTGYTVATVARWSRPASAPPAAGPVRHFEIPADHPERAATFYRNALGWKVTKWDGPLEYWEITTGPEGDGIDGGLLAREGDAAQPVLVSYVESIDRALRAIRRAGGTVVVDKNPVPGVGWQAYFRDTEGNYLAVFELDPRAR